LVKSGEGGEERKGKESVGREKGKEKGKGEEELNRVP